MAYFPDERNSRFLLVTAATGLPNSAVLVAGSGISLLTVAGGLVVGNTATSFDQISGQVTTGQLPSTVVTSVGNLSPLFNASITSQALSFVLLPVASGTLYGNSTNTSGTPQFFAPGSADQLLGVKHSGDGLEYKSLTSGTGISLTPSACAIQIANTGVTSLLQGTQIVLSGSTGAVTVSTSATSFSALSGQVSLVQLPSSVVLSVNAGTGISVASLGSSVTVSNTGVLSIGSSDGTLSYTASTGNVLAAVATSVALAGNPTTTTQSTGDSSSRIATTAFVTTAVTNATGAAVPTTRAVNTGTGLSGGGTLASDLTLVNTGVTSAVAGGGIAVSASTGTVVVGNTASSFSGISGTAQPTQGGTGLSVLPTANKLLGVNDAGTAFEGVAVAVGGGLALDQTGAQVIIGNTASSFSGISGSVSVGQLPASVVLSTRAVNTGTGLSGGGNLSTDLTLVNTGVTSAVAGGGISLSASTGTVIIGNTASSFSGISGTVSTAQQPTTTVNSVGNAAPLFTASIAAQALSFVVSNAASGTILANPGSTSTAPSYMAPGTADQLLSVKHTGDGLEYKSLVAGGGISLIASAGSIVLGNTASSVGSVLTTKGDLLGYSTVSARIPAGTDTQGVVYDSTQSTGIRTAWGNLFGITASSTSLTLTSAASSVQLIDATSGALVVTLPSASTCLNKVFVVKKTDSSTNHVTVTAAGAATIDGSATFVLKKRYDALMIMSDATNWWIL